MRVDRVRENAFRVTATGQELSALIAAARMSLHAMESAPDVPPAALDLLRRVLDDYDRARNRLEGEPGNGGGQL